MVCITPWWEIPHWNLKLPKTLEAGYRYEAQDISFGITYFDYRFVNLIDFDPGPPPGLVNRSRVDSKGFEANLQGQLIDERSTFSLAYVTPGHIVG